MVMMANDLNYRVSLKSFAFFVIIVFGCLGFCLYPSGYVDALTLTPGRFEIRGNPGETLNEEILLINEGENVEAYYSSFSNFEAQGESGSPAFVEPKDGLGTWITTPISSVSLAPRQQKIVPFTVTIPKDAEPGGHFAVIFWGTSPGGGGGQVAVGAKTGILVLLSVNGDVKEEAGLLDFNTIDKRFFYNTLPVSMEYRFRNDGGDRIKPEGKITIRDTIFFPAEYLDANPVEGNVLPNSTRKIKVDWIKYERPAGYIAPTGFFSKFWSDVGYQWKNFALGLYSANLNVAYGAQGQHVKKTTFFFVFPWQLVLVMLVVFIIVFFGGKKLIKHYNKFIIKKATETTGAGRGLPPGASHGK
jgi:hypothetical protein